MHQETEKAIFELSRVAPKMERAITELTAELKRYNDRMEARDKRIQASQKTILDPANDEATLGIGHVEAWLGEKAGREKNE